MVLGLSAISILTKRLLCTECSSKDYDSHCNTWYFVAVMILNLSFQYCLSFLKNFHFELLPPSNNWIQLFPCRIVGLWMTHFSLSGHADRIYRAASNCTSVTTVLWKVSALYTHPWPHGTRSVRLSCSRTPEEKQEESEEALQFWLSVPGKEDWFPGPGLELSRQ